MAPRLLSLAEAASLFRTTDSFGVPLGPGQPNGLIHELGKRTDWERLDVLAAMVADFYSLFDHPNVFLESMFFGPAERIYRDMGRNVSYIPSDFRRFAPIMAMRNPRILATSASPVDSDGFMSLSLHAGATVDALHAAGADPDRILIVETSPHFPRLLGISDEHSHRLHVDEVDVLIETEARPPVLADPVVGDVERQIAQHAQQFVRDGSTLQTGFGSIPSTIAGLLAEGSGGDYGIHSEMFTTGLMRLHQAGKVTNARKDQFTGFSLATFAAGTEELYEWLHDRTDIRMAPVSVVNSPELIASNRNMVTINGAIAVDLWGQVMADTIAGHQFSGVGGHEDFVAGAGLELDDKSLICLPSTVEINGELHSRIVSSFAHGSVVTTPRHQIEVVVTEFGAVDVEGLSTVDRARALASIAHPQFREELLAGASDFR